MMIKLSEVMACTEKSVGMGAEIPVLFDGRRGVEL